jgi:hypothetical protein
VTFPDYVKAGEDNHTSSDTSSTKADAPHELKVLHLEKNITPVDLRGIGRNDDVAIKFRQETGIVTAPTYYLLLTRANNNSSSELLPVSVPGLPGDDKDFYTLDSEDMDCVNYETRLAHSPDKRTFMIRVHRDLPHGLSPIRLELLELVEDDGMAKPLDGVSTAYMFSLMESRDLKSTACTYDQVMSLVARTFHLKLKL